MSDLNQAQQDLAKTLSDLRSAFETQGGDLSKNLAAIEALGARMESIDKAQADLARTREISDASGADSALRGYKLGREIEIRKNPGSYLTNESGQIRLVGHETHGGHGYRYGLFDEPKPKTEWQREVQEIATLRSIVRNHMDPARRNTPYLDDMLNDAMRGGPEWATRIFADNSAAGSEWIPDNTMASLERQVQHQQGVHKIFMESSLPPGGDLKIPYQEGNLRPYKGAVPTTNNPADATLSDMVTRDNTISAVETVIATQVHRNASEDSIIAVAPQIMADIARAMAFGFDDRCINGDTAGTHMDTIAVWNTRKLWGATGLGGADDHRTGDLGLRARSYDISTTTDLNAAQDASGLRTLLKTMGAEYFSRITTGGTVKILVSPEWFLNKLLGEASMVTWDKAGPAATILTGLLSGRSGPSPGSVGFIHNVEVIMTPMLTADLATSGLFTNSGATTAAIAVDTSDFGWWVRKGLVVESAVNILNNTNTSVARDRRVFRTSANDTTASRKNVSYGFNLTP